MTQPKDEAPLPYRALAAKLFDKWNDQLSLVWLAKRLDVSPVAVSFWKKGKCRPRPGRLGYLSAILGFDEEDLGELTILADYDADQHEMALAAYREWPSACKKFQMARSARRSFLDWALEQIGQDVQLRQRLRDQQPQIYAAVQEVIR